MKKIAIKTLRLHSEIEEEAERRIASRVIELLIADVQIHANREIDRAIWKRIRRG